MTNFDGTDGFLTVQDVAAQLSLSSSTVRQWIKYKKLRAYRFSANCLRIDPADLDAFLADALVGKSD